MAEEAPFKALHAVIAALVETGRVPPEWMQFSNDAEGLIEQIRASGPAMQHVNVPSVERLVSPYNIDSVVHLHDESSINTLAIIEPKETRVVLVNKVERGLTLTFLRRDISEMALDSLTEGIDLVAGQSERLEAAAASEWTDDGGYSTKSGSM